MSVLTRQQAVALAGTEWWVGMSDRDVAVFQMRVRLLCMPWALFQAAIEGALGRGVFTHEFGMDWDGLERELLGERPTPTIDEVMELIPIDKRICLVIDEEEMS